MVFSSNKKLSALIPPAPARPPEIVTPGHTSPPAATAVLDQNLKPSELFDGNPDLCGGFLLQCKWPFKRAPTLFSSDIAKISYIIIHEGMPYPGLTPI